MNSPKVFRAIVVSLLMCFGRVPSGAQTSWIVHNFTGNDGSVPVGSLLLSGTTLYGTASCGGIASAHWRSFGNYNYFYGDGVVFKVNLDGSGYSLLKRFNGTDGRIPRAGLVLSGNTLYGTTSCGGANDAGTVFKVNTDGQGFAVIKDSSGGLEGYPEGGLVLDGTTLYGTTCWSTTVGSVFKLSTDGSGFNTIKRFNGNSDGGDLQAGLVLSGATLYGTTAYAGDYGWGTIFKVNTNGSGFAVLRSFAGGADGGNPCASLVLSGSTLYGTTSSGGNDYRGTVFKINTDGTGYAVLWTFIGNGGGPGASLVLSGTTLYGTTIGGVLFQLNTDGTGFTVLKSFNEVTDGRCPRALVLSQGALYGEISSIPNLPFDGSLYGFALPTAAPVIVLAPQSQVLEVGSSASLSVHAAGAGLAYQWFFNGTEALPDGDNSTLQLTNLQPPRAGAYTVVVTNSYGAVTSAPVNFSMIPPGTSPVGSCTEVALRAALHGASAVTFACDGTIALTGTIAITNDVVLDGSGHQVTISGGNLTPIFQVNTNVTFTIANLTLVNGFGTNGGAIYNNGTVNITNATCSGNCAYGAAIGPPESAGGAIYNCGTLNASRCVFRQNSANGALGTNGTSSGSYPTQPGAGSAGRPANGGAIYSLGVMAVDRSVFASNTLAGGAGGDGGSGGQYGVLTVDQTGGTGGAGGNCNGAAVFTTGPAVFANCTFAQNAIFAGPGGRGGSGGYEYDPRGVPVDFAGGNGGNGGSGFGVICDTNGLVRLTNCTVAANSAVRGNGGPAGCNLVEQIRCGTPGNNGTACGGMNSAGGALLNTILAGNSGGNTCGELRDLGHNLSSDMSCSFSALGSLNGTDPKLGLLADNGGSTLTMALCPGSPAIDAADTSAAPPTDQRDAPRPVGPAADIGAVEYGWPAALRILNAGPDGFDLLACGNATLPCRVLASTSLSDWVPIATNQFGADGTVVFHIESLGASRMYYRLVLP